MSTKTTAIGPNSVAINYSINATATELLDAIEAFVTAKGWAVFDAEAGTNQRVYRALNADETTYKYVMVDISNGSFLGLRVFESWDAEAHSGTNEASDGNTTSYQQRLSLAYSGYVYVFATARWLVMQARENNGNIGTTSGEAWTGCLEISRDNPDETPGDYPIYAWAEGYGFVGEYASGSYPNCFSLPRTVAGRTGAYAQQAMTVATLAGATWSSNAKLFDMLPPNVNPLSDTDDVFVLTPFAVETNQDGGSFNIRGRFYGVKLLSRNLGSLLDKITIKTDVDAFYSPNGTDTEHHILTATGNTRIAIPS